MKKKIEGASLVEYGLLVSLIAIVALLAIRFLGTTTSGKYKGLAEQVYTE